MQSRGDYLKITGIHARSTIGTGVTDPGVKVRSRSGGVGGMGVPGVRVRFLSGGVGGGIGVVVIKNNKGISARIFIGE